jgi:hypothetical protein
MLVFFKFQNRFARPCPGEKGFGIEPVIGEPPLGASLAPMNKRASQYRGANAKMKQPLTQ